MIHEPRFNRFINNLTTPDILASVPEIRWKIETNAGGGICLFFTIEFVNSFYANNEKWNFWQWIDEVV